MTRPRTLADLKAAPYNPRKIDAKAFSGLKASVAAFGDISGIVWNERTGHLVCGHQRILALTTGGKCRLDPDKMALVTEDGREFPVRLVDWDEATEKAANVAANSPHIAGEFTDGLVPILAELDAKLPDLSVSLCLPELRADVAAPGEPAPDQAGGEGVPDEPSRFELVCEFETEAELRAAFERLRGEGFACRVLTY